MINRDAVIYRIGITGYQPGAVDLAIIDAGLNPTGTYDPKTSSLIVTKAAIAVLEGMLALSAIKEGGYEIDYSEEGIKARLGYLNGSIGQATTPQPILRAVHKW